MLTTLLSFTMLATQVIQMPGFQLASQATPPNVHTKWTYRQYDDSFFRNQCYDSYRSDSSIMMPYFLTPQKYFVGQEDYVQHIDIPADWQEQIVTLFLERVHIVSHVCVNGVEARSLYSAPQVGLGCRSLGAPHRYDLTGLLQPGQQNELRITVDNRLTDVPVGCNSYSVSDDDQGNWNGYIGRAELIAQPTSRLIYDATQIWPNIETQTASIMLRLGHRCTKTEKLQLRLTTEAGQVTRPIVLSTDSQSIQVDLEHLNLLWDEYHPNLYHLKIELLDKKGRLCDSQSLQFGMRDVTTDKHFIRVNGRPVYLRGTVDGAQFPMTGYPPMDRAYWTQYFDRLKPWGVNVVRFHSWCPPEAAFASADSLGIYMQVECSSWSNHDVSLIPGNKTAQYLEQEADQILQAYGHHPSLLLLAAGNEPKGQNWTLFADQWVENNRQRDARHLYYSFAVGGSWPWNYANQLHVRAGYRGVDWDRRRPESVSDFNSAIDTMQVPFIGHEIGQWSTFPALRDIPKFTGFMRSAHSEICRDLMRSNGLEALSDSFLLASGRLQVLAYKFEMERIRRTRHYGGYGLQALADYTGQGTSNEGILNVFLEPKGYVTPNEWLQWAGEVVPLMRTSRFVYSTMDTLHFAMELSNMSSGDLLQQPSSYCLYDGAGRVLAEHQYPLRDFPWGGGLAIGQESVALSDLGITEACQLRLEVSVGAYHNDWNLWVYPPVVDLDADDIYVTRVLDERVQATLAQGGKVLLLCFNQINMGRNIKQNLLPEFWNHLWSSRFSSHTHGLLIQHEHPIFRHFPTAYHSDLQWWELINRTYPMWMEDLPQVRPLVQSIDNAYSCRRLGMLFEVRVGAGRLVVTNIDLNNNLGQRRVARQLYSSILQYMKSDDFHPKDEVNFNQIMTLFTNFRMN